jgi:hypothetical protein
MKSPLPPERASLFSGLSEVLFWQERAFKKARIAPAGKDTANNSYF